MNNTKLLGVSFTEGTFKSILEEIFVLSQETISSYICMCNVHMLLEAKEDNNFNKILNDADIVTRDGMPIAKALSWSYSVKQERLCGMDLMPVLIKECSRRNKSIYFYGSTDKVLNNINKRITKDYPKLDSKYYSPPFRELSRQEDNEIIDEINEFNADFVFVALGCPKQERWMASHKGTINSCMIGLGGAFPVYAGLQDRAPKWMCNNSLEWFYRLILEPRRLFGRYFKTNFLFFLYLIIDSLKRK